MTNDYVIGGFDDKEKQLIACMDPFCAPLYFAKHKHAGADEITNNGTVALIDTGKRLIFVTAYHVIKFFFDKKKENPELTLLMGTGDAQSTVILEDVKLVDGEERYLDIAIFEFKNHQYYPVGKKQFYRMPQAGFKVPNKGEPLAFLGFPGKYRGPKLNGILSRSFLFCDEIISVTESNILCTDEKLERITKVYEEGIGEPVLGGSSGSPCYIRRNGVLELVGFLKETLGAHSEIIKFVRADFINQNGKLDWGRIV